ncbi:anti-sigma regulatory factor (Ser/Thr protein kinase) [Kineococcus xinjiangensis]|uniref:Anti-sigma regulatory factor (Ser/Thr protein kinase) n=1 Tax=Kineococcus xinjiangensis TaxID=512762 RepID=A0A2S6IHW2_9ACTN|nr:ATP-binding protein [Kineococcus xinjiangensis]PPK93809.1 anti-sigma regulatory factor (Ser/Thr protein kinase) [Kineococcus xinjiangensis]
MEHRDAAGRPQQQGVLRCALDLPATLRAAGAARRAARAVLLAWGHTDAATHDVVELVITELVTNAVRHTGSAAEVPRLHLESGEPGSGEDLLVAVSDGSSIRLVVKELTETEESGRGLGIVAALGSAWGVEDWEGGKRVWVRLPVSTSGSVEVRMAGPGQPPRQHVPVEAEALPTA